MSLSIDYIVMPHLLISTQIRLVSVDIELNMPHLHISTRIRLVSEHLLTDLISRSVNRSADVASMCRFLSNRDYFHGNMNQYDSCTHIVSDILHISHLISNKYGTYYY